MKKSILGPVKIYRNTHKKCWSIKEKDKKVYHCQSAMMLSCLFKVSELGRQRVVNTGRKNVHAWIIGNLAEIDSPPYLIEVNQSLTFREVRYNPYVWDQFFYWINNKSSIFYSDMVILTDKGKVYAKL